MGVGRKPCVVLPRIMRSSSLVRLHSRGDNAERILVQSQEDFRGQHACTKAPTPIGAKQLTTKGRVDYWLYPKNQGIVRHYWINQYRHR